MYATTVSHGDKFRPSIVFDQAHYVRYEDFDNEDAAHAAALAVLAKLIARINATLAEEGHIRER